jgi:hypothetical protein
MEPVRGIGDTKIGPQVSVFLYQCASMRVTVGLALGCGGGGGGGGQTLTPWPPNHPRKAASRPPWAASLFMQRA